MTIGRQLDVLIDGVTLGKRVEHEIAGLFLGDVRLRSWVDEYVERRTLLDRGIQMLEAYLPIVSRGTGTGVFDARPDLEELLASAIDRVLRAETDEALYDELRALVDFAERELFEPVFDRPGVRGIDASVAGKPRLPTFISAEEPSLDTFRTLATHVRDHLPGEPRRFADFHLYREIGLGERGAELSRDAVLNAGAWYQLDVSVVDHRTGIPPERDDEAIAPMRPLHVADRAQLYVTVEGDGVEVEEPTSSLQLGNDGLSDAPATFRVRPTRQTTDARTRAKLRVRIFYRLNLIEVCTIHAEVAGRLDPDTQRMLAADRPVFFRQERLETRYDEIAELRPRAVHVDVTNEDGAYRFTVTFKGDYADEALPFVAPIRVTPDALDLDLTAARRALMAASFASDDTAREAALRRLAQTGRALWGRLFRENPAGAAWKVGELLRDYAPTEGTIQISVDQSARTFVFPWNLLYDRELARGEAVTLDGFWGMRYAVEQRVPGVPAGTDRPIDPGPDFEIGYMAWPFAQTTAQTEFVRALAKRGGGKIFGDAPIVASAAAYEYLGDCRSRVLYFFTHGHARVRDTDVGMVRLEDVVRLIDALPADSPRRAEWSALQQELEKRKTGVDRTWIALRYGMLYLDELRDKTIRLSGNALVFLNMCESAQLTPSLSDSLVEFFVTRGARAVVGTECLVDPGFADRFSRTFLESFFAGGPVGATLLAARKECARDGDPSGLAYTLYGPAYVRFEPAPIASPPATTPGEHDGTIRATGTSGR